MFLRWRRFVVAGIGALSLLGIGTTGAGASPADRLIEFDSMHAVSGTAEVNKLNDRDLLGGGAPWSIVSGTGSVDRQGHLSVTVHGLIVVPLGRNPISPFEAVVSCLTPDGVMNVETTGIFPATKPGGDSTINATVDLPHPCKSPEVFVGGTPGNTFLWFARSNAESDD